MSPDDGAHGDGRISSSRRSVLTLTGSVGLAGVAGVSSGLLQEATPVAQEVDDSTNPPVGSTSGADN